VMWANSITGWISAGEVRQHRRELLQLEEPGSDVVLFEHRDVGSIHQLRCLYGKGEHRLQQRQFTIDFGIAGRAPLLGGRPSSRPAMLRSVPSLTSTVSVV
jgi:hypothetical protein